MGSYCYQPHHIRVTLVKVHAGNWRWRLLDHFSAQLAEGCGCRTKDIARKVAKLARAGIIQRRCVDQVIKHSHE